MKKALLSVVAAGLVATAVAPAALAVDLTKGLKETQGDVSKEVSFSELQKDRVVQEGKQSEAKTKADAEKAKDKHAGNKLVVDKGQATKAKPAGKVLPKTSAAK